MYYSVSEMYQENDVYLDHNYPQNSSQNLLIETNISIIPVFLLLIFFMRSLLWNWQLNTKTKLTRILLRLIISEMFLMTGTITATAITLNSSQERHETIKKLCGLNEYKRVCLYHSFTKKRQSNISIPKLVHYHVLLLKEQKCQK